MALKKKWPRKKHGGPTSCLPTHWNVVSPFVSHSGSSGCTGCGSTTLHHLPQPAEEPPGAAADRSRPVREPQLAALQGHGRFLQGDQRAAERRWGAPAAGREDSGRSRLQAQSDATQGESARTSASPGTPCQRRALMFSFIFFLEGAKRQPAHHSSGEFMWGARWGSRPCCLKKR